MALVIRSAEELLDVVPHLLGFKPEESLIMIPLKPDLPVFRVDLPRTFTDREELLDAVRAPIVRHASPGSMAAVVCLTEDRRSAELASEHLAAGLRALGVGVPLRLWATDERWVELNTGQAGNRTRESALRVAAESVAAGVAQPAASRSSLEASMVGDREPIAAILPAARAAAQRSGPGADRDWARGRLQQFHGDGNRLSDKDAARLLVALENVRTRDALWEDVTRGEPGLSAAGEPNTSSHIALWGDLTRRAPDEVRAAPASLLAFSSWLAGDGARTWCALDQVPPDQPYRMANLVAATVQNGLHPREWENLRTAVTPGRDLDESFVPKPHGHRHGDEGPLGPVGPERPSMGR